MLRWILLGGMILYRLAADTGKSILGKLSWSWQPFTWSDLRILKEELRLRLLVINGNSFDISIEGISASASHDGITLAVVNSAEGIHIGAGKQAMINLKLKIITENALTHIGEMIEQGGLTKPLIINGHFMAKGIKVPFYEKIPLIK